MHFKISSNEQYYTGNTNNTFSVIFFFHGETCDSFRGAVILYISIDR